MGHRIVWSRRAVLDLDTITDYIAADSGFSAGTRSPTLDKGFQELAFVSFYSLPNGMPEGAEPRF
jgi:plasmid stabilization system protein ParE